jgi:beta-N-acetylhexosaminidase
MTPAIFGLAGPVLTDDERAFFRDADPAGYILFGRNVVERAQLRALTDELRAIHGRDRLLVSIDQEGGRVARMKPPEWEAFPAGRSVRPLWQVAPASAIEAARANCRGARARSGRSRRDGRLPAAARRAPAGRARRDRRPRARQRADAGRRARSRGARRLARAGVTGCVKHMPGHGRACADSHKELPTVEASEAELAIDIEPFRTLADAPIGMTAHVRYTAWDADCPGTFSPIIINEIIRSRIGFTGLLLTDDIDMEALDGAGARARRAGDRRRLRRGPQLLGED